MTTYPFFHFKTMIRQIFMACTYLYLFFLSAFSTQAQIGPPSETRPELERIEENRGERGGETRTERGNGALNAENVPEFVLGGRSRRGPTPPLPPARLPGDRIINSPTRLEPVEPSGASAAEPSPGNLAGQRAQRAARLDAEIAALQNRNLVNSREIARLRSERESVYRRINQRNADLTRDLNRIENSNSPTKRLDAYAREQAAWRAGLIESEELLRLDELIRLLESRK